MPSFASRASIPARRPAYRRGSTRYRSTRAVASLLPKCLNGVASNEETMLFQQLWQARVRTLLLDFADDPQVIVVRH
jgi:hypothetical protein